MLAWHRAQTARVQWQAQDRVRTLPARHRPLQIWYTGYLENEFIVTFFFFFLGVIQVSPPTASHERGLPKSTAMGGGGSQAGTEAPRGTTFHAPHGQG